MQTPKVCVARKGDEPAEPEKLSSCVMSKQPFDAEHLCQLGLRWRLLVRPSARVWICVCVCG